MSRATAWLLAASILAPLACAPRAGRRDTTEEEARDRAKYMANVKAYYAGIPEATDEMLPRIREHALPEAVLRFRQGHGRLIRRRGDRGVCVVLDPRIVSARYGEAFREVLPTPPVVVADGEDLARQVGAWLSREPGAEGEPAWARGRG